MRKMPIFKVIGFAGSLRANSFNRGLLAKASEILPDGLSLEIMDLKEIPLYNDDTPKECLPKPVEHFRQKIEAADALLIASPEYNYSISGVLKNALDWASSDTFGNVIAGKITAIMGASKGRFGTTRGQMHLRQTLHAMNAKLLSRPEVFISYARDLFGDNGLLADAATIERIHKLLAALSRELNIQKGAS